MANINNDQNFPSVSISISDSQGRPATVDGAPVWASSDETILTVEASADGMSAAVNTVGAGTARISVTADADLGSGTQEIVGVSEDVVVALGPSHTASTFGFTFGAPVDK